MSSEAAKKAYPIRGHESVEYRIQKVLQRQAFDAGAVEALRQAADMMRRAGEMGGPDWIDRMADEWRRGSA